jgi:photosystem II stability/assembly factor-like uncharacterized protein
VDKKPITIGIIVILGIAAIVMLFLVAFRYFKPDTEKSGADSLADVEARDDPTSTIYVSEDGGSSWRGVPGAAFATYHILFDNGHMIVGTDETSVWQADATARFMRVDPFDDGTNGLLPDSSIFGLAHNLDAGASFYAIARQSDESILVRREGIAWRELFFAPLEDFPLRALAVDPFQPERLLVTGGTGLYISEDAGETWRVAHRFRNEILRLLAHPHVPGRFFITTRKGELFRTSDYGETWEEFTRAIRTFKGSRNNQRLYVDPITGIVYLTSDHGLLVSYTDGTAWREAPLIVPPDTLPVIGFAVHPTDYATLYVTAGNQIYKSKDAGRTWKGSRFPAKGPITIIAVNPDRPEMVIIGFLE